MAGRRRKTAAPRAAEDVTELGAEVTQEAVDLVPVPKIAAATAVGTPLALVIVWLAGLADLDVPPEVAAALGALIAAAVGYVKSNRGYLTP